MSKWEKEEIDFLISSLKEGKNYKEIATCLNKTWSSVRNKSNSLGIKYNDFSSYDEKRICLKCETEFVVKRFTHNKFCSHSCSASFTNKGRKHSFDTKKKMSGNDDYKEKIFFDNCLNCGLENPTNHQKCCSKFCTYELRREEKIKEGTLGEQSVKRYLIKKYGAKCWDCGWDKVNSRSGLPTVQLEHIDGNSKNNKLLNLKILCPNCHSLTPTFGALNKGNGRRKYIQRK